MITSFQSTFGQIGTQINELLTFGILGNIRSFLKSCGPDLTGPGTIFGK